MSVFDSGFFPRLGLKGALAAILTAAVGSVCLAAAAFAPENAGWAALAGALVLGVALPLALAAASRIERGVAAAAAEAARLADLDFSRARRTAPAAGCEALAGALETLRGALARHDREISAVQVRLERLIAQGIALAAERDTARLMQSIVEGAKELANAEGGTLYLRDDDDVLRFEILHNDVLRIRQGGSDGPAPALPGVPLYDGEGRPNHANVVSHAVHLERAVAIDDAYGAEGFDFSGTRTFDARTGYRSQSFLTVPLKPRGGAVIGALQLINARDPETGAVAPFPPAIERLVEALAGQAATALDNRLLLDSQDHIMDGMVRFVAGAIDAKSPYTGNHCARVPELALMLAEAASAATAGPFANFAFTTPEEWREFRIGAWLHDCGKVTTPEFVIDKATKLETVVNRIHEVRTRFEVLRRDAEIARLEALRAGEDEAAANARFGARVRELEDDFGFVAQCNVGSESMSDADVARLVRIAATPWRRHFDDRLGLSHGELARLEGIPPAPLPAVERLLADRREHVVAHGPSEPAFDPSWGFTVKPTAVRFNFGELHNLSVRKGTLTDEERAIINQHIVQTIVMLESLPFPRHLRRVPEYAGTHHETLTGSGYPRGLTAADLSIPARIMAVADVFEALTAADRPYKKAKPLSEAVGILKDMADARAIDPDVFALFLESGVARRYAERFLDPAQIDAFEPSRYLPEAGR
ncbi:Methyl-accepting chemotaxis protein (fragment) [uncultured Alphaproteobacteria bacterium]|uniref:Methyl-accepting chemotaxis protein n=1 Tax=uncultured Alphaproteobacteria bacterium TaxID=91750 RepID=A0A212JVV2_9PROT